MLLFIFLLVTIAVPPHVMALSRTKYKTNWMKRKRGSSEHGKTLSSKRRKTIILSTTNFLVYLQHTSHNASSSHTSTVPRHIPPSPNKKKRCNIITGHQTRGPNLISPETTGLRKWHVIWQSSFVSMKKQSQFFVNSGSTFYHHLSRSLHRVVSSSATTCQTPPPFS